MSNKEEAKNKKNLAKGVKAELKKVTWLSPAQLVKNTIAVLTIVLVATVIVFISDLIFKTINENIVTQIENSINDSETDVLVDTTETETEVEIDSEEKTESSDTEEEIVFETVED